MGVGDILDEMIRLFRQNFLTFIGIAAVLQVPLGILQSLQFAILGPALYDFPYLATFDEIDWGPFVLWSLSSLVLGLFSLFAYVVIDAALTGAISQRYLDRQISVGGSYHLALSSFWRVLGASILVSIVVGVLLITIIGIPVAVFLAVRWALCVQAIVIGGQGFGLSRSSGLVKGTWWRVFGILIVAMIIQYLVYILPSALVGAIVGLVGSIVAPGSFLVTNMVSSVIGMILGIVAAPIIPIISTLLYYDLRIRKEGFDLEMLNEQLAQG